MGAMRRGWTWNVGVLVRNGDKERKGKASYIGVRLGYEQKNG
jgi:hypothetical protein